jgi:hypothetical protein
MLKFLDGRRPDGIWDLPIGRRASPRKFRLFAAGCCRQFWHLLRDERSRQAVEIAEECIDRRIDHGTRIAAAARAFDATVFLRRMREQEIAVHPRRQPPTVAASRSVLIQTLGDLIRVAGPGPEPSHRCPEEQAAHVAFRLTAWSSFGGYDAAEGALALSPGEAYRGFCHLLRCVFGNPFRQPAARAAWKTAAVLALARAVYDERRFSDLPILADALEEAGCDNADLLAHCRGPGPHVRGCWAVDLLLAKS